MRCRMLMLKKQVSLNWYDAYGHWPIVVGHICAILFIYFSFLFSLTDISDQWSTVSTFGDTDKVYECKQIILFCYGLLINCDHHSRRTYSIAIVKSLIHLFYRKFLFLLHYCCQCATSLPRSLYVFWYVTLSRVHFNFESRKGTPKVK